MGRHLYTDAKIQEDYPQLPYKDIWNVLRIFNNFTLHIVYMSHSFYCATTNFHLWQIWTVSVTFLCPDLPKNSIVSVFLDVLTQKLSCGLHPLSILKDSSESGLLVPTRYRRWQGPLSFSLTLSAHMLAGITHQHVLVFLINDRDFNAWRIFFINLIFVQSFPDQMMSIKHYGPSPWTPGSNGATVYGWCYWCG